MEASNSERDLPNRAVSSSFVGVGLESDTSKGMQVIHSVLDSMFGAMPTPFGPQLPAYTASPGERQPSAAAMSGTDAASAREQQIRKDTAAAKQTKTPSAAAAQSPAGGVRTQAASSAGSSYSKSSALSAVNRNVTAGKTAGNAQAKPAVSVLDAWQEGGRLMGVAGKPQGETRDENGSVILVHSVQGRKKLTALLC